MKGTDMHFSNACSKFENCFHKLMKIQWKNFQTLIAARKASKLNTKFSSLTFVQLPNIILAHMNLDKQFHTNVRFY